MRTNESASQGGKSFNIRTETPRDDSVGGTAPASKPNAKDAGLSRSISAGEGKGYPEKKNKFD